MGDARLLAVLLVPLVVTSGCAGGLPSVRQDQFDLEDLPGMGAVDLSNALLELELEGCRETHLILTANAAALALEVPGAFEFAHRQENETKLTVSLVECEQVTAGNETYSDTALLEIGVPIERSEATPKRSDALLAVGAPDDALTARLEAAGLPTVSVDKVERNQQRSYSIAEQSTLSVNALEYSFTGQVTSVSIETELPFGTAGSIGRTGWAVAEHQTLQVRRGLNATEVGGLSATLVLSPGGELAELTDNRTVSAHGFEVRYDARIGVTVQAEAAGGSRLVDDVVGS